MERRLAAILAADVVGYSALVSEDEDQALTALKDLRRGLFEPAVTSHQGTVVKRMGDGWLVEFPSIGEAVKCAIEIQEGLVDHEIIKLRIGIHIGDVAFDEEDIFGDGVNIAARLEALADPGQILISDSAHHSLDNKTTQLFYGGEEHKLKNITRAVAIWRWPAGDTHITQKITVPQNTDKPSIVVLPFGSMPGDAEQEFLADGLAEDITTLLSNLRWMFVIARNSAATYKGQAINIADVGKELGVRYILEGSIRKAGNRVRVNAQLIEAASGAHLWADKYDREIDDIFAIQDDITKSIVGMLETEIANAEQIASMQRPANMDAWTAYHLGMSYLGKNYSADDLKQSYENFSTAVKLDPNFAAAYAGLSVAGLLYHGWGRLDINNIAEMRQRSLENAQRAVRLDERDPWPWAALARAQLYNHDIKGAQRSAERALNLSPNSYQALWSGAIVTGLTGDTKRALELIDEVDKVSPRSPFRQVLSPLIKGIAYLFLARSSGEESDYQVAMDHIDQSIAETPGVWPRLIRCALLHELGQHEEAKAEVTALNATFSEFSADNLRYFSFFPDPEVNQWFLDTLLSIGLRDQSDS